MPGARRPTLPGLLLAGVLTAMTGEVSVAPYPSNMRTPYFSFQVAAVDSRIFSAPAMTRRALKKS